MEEIDKLEVVKRERKTGQNLSQQTCPVLFTELFVLQMDYNISRADNTPELQSTELKLSMMLAKN